MIKKNKYLHITYYILHLLDYLLGTVIIVYTGTYTITQQLETIAHFNDIDFMI